MMGATVRQIMSPAAAWAHVDHSLVEAAVRMRAANVGVLLVVDGDEVVGVVTDRDLVIRGVAGGLDLQMATVSDVMTKHVVHCEPETTLVEAARLMAHERIRRLAVADEDCEVLGILSLDDLARPPGGDKLAADALGAIARPLATAKMPAPEDSTGGRARRSAPGAPHVYSERPRIGRRKT